MTAQRIDGRAIAEKIRERIRAQARERDRRPCLAGLMFGGDDSARMYAASHGRTAAEVDIDYKLIDVPPAATLDLAHETLDRLNRDPAIDGIVLYQPLPANTDAAALQWSIAPAKDVEGVNPANIGRLALGRPALPPCTAAAAVECARSIHADLAGREAVVVGRSAIVGRPAAMLLLAASATVTQCHSQTRQLAEVCRRAEILVVAAGKPGLIGREHVRPGAVVIDVGTHRITTTDAHGKDVRRTVGDVRFDEVLDVASAITPVPGGVGPVTVAMLLQNVVTAATSRR